MDVPGDGQERGGGARHFGGEEDVRAMREVALTRGLPRSVARVDTHIQ